MCAEFGPISFIQYSQILLQNKQSTRKKTIKQSYIPFRARSRIRLMSSQSCSEHSPVTQKLITNLSRKTASFFSLDTKYGAIQFIKIYLLEIKRSTIQLQTKSTQG